MSGGPTWSIIIPAFNEEKHLRECLQSLCSLSYPNIYIDVIVVDNGSTDATIGVAQSFSDRLPIKTILALGDTVAGVRNAGAAVARGDHFAFLDADCVAQERWLDIASGVLFRNPISVLGASYDVPPSAGWPARVWHRFFHTQNQGSVTYVPASNLLIPATLFRRIGGFDERLPSNEDGQICAKAKQVGATVLAVPELRITHLGAERNLIEFVRRQFWHGSSVLNRVALTANVRAIAIALYTSACFTWILIALIAGQFAKGPLLAMALPPVFIILKKAKRISQFADLPRLFVLILCYSLARAAALPVAALKFARMALSEAKIRSATE